MSTDKESVELEFFSSTRDPKLSKSYLFGILSLLIFFKLSFNVNFKPGVDDLGNKFNGDDISPNKFA